jgi:hypothetical protein
MVSPCCSGMLKIDYKIEDYVNRLTKTNVPDIQPTVRPDILPISVELSVNMMLTWGHTQNMLKSKHDIPTLYSLTLLS